MSSPENIPAHRATQQPSVVVHETLAPEPAPATIAGEDKAAAAPVINKTASKEK